MRHAVCRMPSGAVKSCSGLLPHLRRDERRHGRLVAIGEKDGAGVGAQRVDEPRAVVLLVPARPLVLLDEPGVVVVDVADGDESPLAVRAHLLLVKVEARAGLAHEHAVALEPEEILPRPGVDGVAVGIGAGRQVDFRAVDVQQAARPAGRQRAASAASTTS